MAEYRALHPPRWREAGEHVELYDPVRERWTLLHGWTSTMLAAVARGAPVAELADIVPTDASKRGKAEARAKRFLFNLARLGYVDIPVELPPALLAGRYERVKELGRGGVGVAYLYRDRESAGPVVVKRAWDFLQPYRVTEEAMRREAEVMRALDHDGIARYRDEVEVGGHLHLVRDFLDGDDLVSFAGTGIADLRERRRVARGVGEALAHLHERGFLLIDVRPANFILRGPARAPTLLDVGQCRRHGGGAIRFAKRLGSPGFMSPEMARERTIDARSDVWGFGRLCLFLATGILPTHESDPEALLARAPDADRALLARLTADDPRGRPATMRAALALLDEAPPAPGEENV